MLFDVLAIFEPLDDEKGEAKGERHDKTSYREPTQLRLARLRRDRHEEAAGQQHHRVDGSEHDVRLARCGEKAGRLLKAAGRVNQDHAAEEQQLTGEEYPNPERRGFSLRLEARPGSRSAASLIAIGFVRDGARARPGSGALPFS